MIMTAISTDIKCNLESMNAIVKPKRNRFKLTKQLVDFSRIHSDSKQLRKIPMHFNQFIYEF